MIKEYEKGEIFSQIVRVSEVCDQNGDRVFQEWQKLLYLHYKTKRFLVKYENMGLCTIITEVKKLVAIRKLYLFIYKVPLITVRTLYFFGGWNGVHVCAELRGLLVH